MTREEANKMIFDSIQSLLESDAINPIENFEKSSIILGNGSELDSISFITFITDIEDRIQEKTNKEIYLVLSEIDNFNINNPNLTAEGLANYINSIT